ncbi:MAG: aminodeoxychorismate synthase component I [Proteobacteria bacterium]|nr:aminodeoxychorismate synthase component I [Pseudomonadota bacterium]
MPAASPSAELPALPVAEPSRPFVLLDDARGAGAAPARLYTDPRAVVVARRPDQLAAALDRAEALRAEGLVLAGHIAYEAGLALEPRLAGLAAARSGADRPLLWLGAFAGHAEIPAAGVSAWLGGASAAGRLGPLDPQLSPGAYVARFTELHEAIRAGDIYQANFTLPLAGSWRGDPLALYAALRAAGGGGHGGVIWDGAGWLLSCSPELFFQIEAGALTLRPMKGTRPRGATPDEDAALAADLAASTKDRAENLMILDLMRNDASRLAVPGSVRVEAPFAIESYPAVHQMVSTVQARLAPGLTLAALLRALFPCGSVTGTPKIRAMELLGGAERDPRGTYCGAIGRIDPPGSADGTGDAAFNVAIRTLRLAPDGTGGGRAVLGVGSAIVADSGALPEWRECMVKGGFVRQAAAGGMLAGFDLIETMHFAPDSGIALIEAHLERLKASAGTFGFAFDRHAARNAIQALCFELDAPARVRLVVSPSGAYALEAADLPAALPDPVPCVVLPHPLDPGDWRLAHKTSDRGFYEAGLKVARGAGAAEALLIRDDGLLTEGCFTNLFVERDGRLLTPPARLGLLPGVLRRSLLDAGRAVEAELRLEDLAGGFLIGNALRGLVAARLA